MQTEDIISDIKMMYFQPIMSLRASTASEIYQGSLTEREGSVSTVDLHVLTSLDQLLFKLKI